MASYEVVIGLEIHAQLKTASKLFCSCPTTFGDEANHNVCEVCSGMPGALPRLNAKAVELAATAGLALNCTINERSIFSRKNYFYPDLPNGFQTSQFTPPICGSGYLDISVGGETKRIRITRIHMEDDAGKCVHGQGGNTFVDLNRAGTPLVEIVTEPDIRSAEEAALLMKNVHAILVSIGVTDGNMEEGSMRCDANVSLRPKGTEPFGTRTEIKNLNSFRNIQRAIESEIIRQEACLEDGEAIVQETRLFDSVKQTTQAMRTKEDAHDYRYFPNPDLPVVVISKERISQLRDALPELPEAKKSRFMEQYGLPEEDATVLTSDYASAEYYEATVALYNQPKRIANVMRSEFLRECSQAAVTPQNSKVTPAHLAELASIIDKGLISPRIAHEIFPELFLTGAMPEAFAKERGLVQVSDAGELESIVMQVLEENPAEVDAFKGGKDKLISFFVGQIMRKTKGKANPGMVSELLQKALKG